MEFLKKLGIKKENYGGCLGPSHWSVTTDSGKTESKNPSNGEIIASVYHCSQNDYKDIISQSFEAFKVWRTVPAPASRGSGSARCRRFTHRGGVGVSRGTR